MTMLNPDDRHHIEVHLGRELTAEELATVATFDDLSRGQLDVVAQLERRGILASAYVRAVVPTAGFSETREFVIDIQDFISRKYAPAPLAAEHLYESELGRPLTDHERRVVDLIPDLKNAHRAVARKLAARDPALVRRYLKEVLRSAPAFEVEVLIDHLRRENVP